MRIAAYAALAAAMASLIAAAPAYADHAVVEISIPAGGGVKGCEKTDECFVPSSATMDPGSEVVWTNDDTIKHTIVSGDIHKGLTNVFNSGLIEPGQTFSTKLVGEGTYDYFCMIHPWESGSITVEAGAEAPSAPKPAGPAPSDSMASSDGQYTVMVYANEQVAAGQEFAFTVSVVDSDGMAAEEAEYGIVAMQDGQQVFSSSGLGSSEFSLTAASDAPVDISVVLDGGQTVDLQVVPEFGAIAVLVLAAAIVTIIAATSRSGLLARA